MQHRRLIHEDRDKVATRTAVVQGSREGELAVSLVEDTVLQQQELFLE